MSEEKPARDYKGWISLAIGACAVWVAYQSFAWQKSQAEEGDASPGGTENTIGTDGAEPGIHSSSGTSNPDNHTEKDPEPVDKHGGPDKGNKDKKKNH